MMKIQAIEDLAKTYYDSKLPYHNFGHIIRALGAADPILVRCREAKVSVDEQVVYLALLFHDAGYHEDHQRKGFPHKEAYAADIATRELHKSDYDQALIKNVELAILGTHREATLVSTEQKIVRAADLAAMASDYGGFRKDAENLRKEHEIITGHFLSADDWKKMVESHVEFYRGQMIHITSSPSVHTSEFHIHAKENLERFLREE